MPGLVPGIHVLRRPRERKTWMAGTTLAACGGSPGHDDTAGSIQQPSLELRRAVSATTRGEPCGRTKDAPMPIYELDGQKPDLPADGRYWVAETATLIGRVRLKTDASVWFGAVLRGDNEWIEIGTRSQVQDNTMIHTDPGFPLVIGENCVIGHNVILHGCTIASNSLIGMGAVVLNGARIGKNCLVGAGAVVTEGKEFPDNSLIVGTPARALRTLDEKAAQAITRDADIYVRRWQQYAKGLKRIR